MPPRKRSSKKKASEDTTQHYQSKAVPESSYDLLSLKDDNGEPIYIDFRGKVVHKSSLPPAILADLDSHLNDGGLRNYGSVVIKHVKEE
jgi:hypothetical protein